MRLVRRPEQVSAFTAVTSVETSLQAIAPPMRSYLEGTYAAGAGLVSILLAAYMYNPG